MEKNNISNALGVDRIGKLLFQYSIPAIVGTVAASLYNIIDRIFIGHGVGPMAISGLALTFPLMNLTAAFGALVGAGASALVSIRMGQRKKNEAILVLGNTLNLNIILGCLVSVVTLLFLDPILYLLGASKETLPYARDFMQVILAGNVFTHIYLGLNNIMRSSGYPKKAMITTLLTVGCNLILAPLFIFGFKWGIRGAALATVLSQLIGTVWVLIHFMNKNNTVHFRRGFFKLKQKIVMDIFSIGMANFLMLLSACLVTLIMNLSLVKYGGDYAIGAFGIIGCIANLFAMIVIGLNQGMQPISGYNYGAKHFDRVIKVFRYTLLTGTGITVLGFLLAEIFPRQIAQAFTTNQNLINLSVDGLRINLMMFPIVGFQMVTTNFFQSIGKARLSILLSLSRQVLFLIPALLIVPHFWGLAGVWGSGPIADFTASLVTLIVLKTQIKKVLR